jgi:hypothetical protein
MNGDIKDIRHKPFVMILLFVRDDLVTILGEFVSVRGLLSCVRGEPVEPQLK